MAELSRDPQQAAGFKEKVARFAVAVGAAGPFLLFGWVIVANAGWGALLITLGIVVAIPVWLFCFVQVLQWAEGQSG